MARRLSIISVRVLILLVGGVLLAPTLDAANFNPTTVDQLNANFADVVNNDVVTLTETIGAGQIVVDINAMNGKAGTNFQLTVNKNGVGLWRLGGAVTDPTTGVTTYGTDNILASGTGANTFNINGGTLELMRGSKITMTGASANFNVAGGASLNARGQNTITITPTNAANGSLHFSNNSNIGVDLMDPGGTLASGGYVLTIAGNVTKSNDADVVNLNILGFKDTETTPITRANLLQYNYVAAIPAGGTIAGPPPLSVADGTLKATVRGEDWNTVRNNSGGRLQGTVMQTAPATAAGAAQSQVYIANLISNLTTVTWTGTINDKWNATDANWTLPNGNTSTFLHGDTVIFDNNALTKDITVNAGGVQIGSPLQNVPANTKFGMFVNGGIYSFTNAAGSNIGLDGPGAVYIDGNQTAVTFNSANSYWGGTVFSNGAIVTIKNAGALGSGLVDMQTMSQLIVDLLNNGSGTISNDINGDAGTKIIKRGTGTVTMTGTVGSAGDTIIEAGTLRNGNTTGTGNGIGTGLLTVYKGATYDAANHDTLIAGLSDGPTDVINPNGGSVLMGTGLLTINAGAGLNHVFSGSITSSNKLYKDGFGTQTFSGDSPAFNGETEINAGTILVQRALSMDQTITPLGTGPVTIGVNGTLQFELTGGAANAAIFNNAIHGTGLLLKANSTDPANPVYNNPDSGVLFLTSNQSDYTGLTDIREGTLRVGSVFATGFTPEVRLSNQSVLQFQLNDSTKDYVYDANNKLISGPYDRIITGDGSVEVMPGVNVYVRGTNDDKTRPDGTPTASNYTGPTSIQVGAKMHLLNAEATGKTSKVDLLTPTSELHLDFAKDQTYDRYITGFGNLIKDDVGVATLALASDGSPMNDYLGETFVNGGTLRLLYAGATGPADVPPAQSVHVEGTGILELAFGGQSYNKGIQGTGGIAKSGPGITTLGGYNSYTGGTHLYGTKNDDGTFTPGGTLSFNQSFDDMTMGYGNLGGGNIYFERGGATLQNTMETSLKANNANQNVIIDAGSTAYFDNQAAMTINGAVLHRDVDEDDPYYNPNDTKSHFSKTGGSDLTLNGTTAWTGRTTVLEGRLINNIPEGTELTVITPGTYVTGNANRTVSALYGTGTVETAAGYTFTIANNAEDLFPGSITGEGNLAKTGTGLLVLTGANFYSGSTTIYDGIVRGNIAPRTALAVYGKYESGGENRTIRSLTGSGVVDMQGKTLTIDMFDKTATDPASVFSGNIVNVIDLVKAGNGTQILDGKYYAISNSVIINQGMLQIGGQSSSVLSQFNVGKDLIVGPNGTLGVGRQTTINVTNHLQIDGTLSAIIGNGIINADSVTIGDESTINISGITDTTGTQTIIQSATDVVGRFKNVTVAGDPSTNVDYLIYGVSYDDPKAVKIGQSLRWYSNTDAHGTFTLKDPAGTYDVGVSLVDITDAAKRGLSPDGTPWDGRTLTKEGPGTLILSAANTYSGPTLVNGGTLKLANADATGGSSKVVLGDAGGLVLDFTGTMKTPIIGTGTGVTKIGDSKAVLSGNNSYTGPTEVRQGSLFVDGSLASEVWVDGGAGFGGNGRVNNTVNFRDGSFFDWRFGRTEAESDLLKVNGVYIGNNVYVRPTTSLLSQDMLQNFDGWKILAYGGTLNREFAGIDSSANPFYDFELDYTQDGFVKLKGFLRNEPRALSDVVATSVSMAQTRMYRSVYQQIAREWSSDCPQHPVDTRMNGQAPRTYRTAWMNFVGRGDQYASNYFDDRYQFQAYGVQVGLSVLSTCCNTLGIMYGREEGKLNNHSDEVRSEDNYLGIYYGHTFDQDYDFRSYIGGGWQRYNLHRQSNGHLYKSNYSGNTLNVDVEFGRRFITERLCVLRPFLGLDLAITRIGSSTETPDNLYTNEYRRYEKDGITQFLSRAGVELGKSWKKFDLNSGIQIAWNWGDTDPETKIVYPVSGGSVYSRGAGLGRFDLVMNVGFNWYFGAGRNTMLYVNYIGDVYLDRQGDTGSNTGMVGVLWRF